MNTIIKLITLAALTLSISFSNTIDNFQVDNSINSDYHIAHEDSSYELENGDISYNTLVSYDVDDVVSAYVRIGAVCNDGTTSTATGSGACSWHGGVRYWLYGYR